MSLSHLELTRNIARSLRQLSFLSLSLLSAFTTLPSLKVSQNHPSHTLYHATKVVGLLHENLYSQYSVVETKKKETMKKNEYIQHK